MQCLVLVKCLDSNQNARILVKCLDSSEMPQILSENA